MFVVEFSGERRVNLIVTNHNPPTESEVRQNLQRLGECDFKIICGGYEFHVHKEKYPFGSKAWMMEQINEKENSIEFLYDAEPRALSQWIQWIYTGRYSVQRQEKVTTDLTALCNSAFQEPFDAATSETGVPDEVEQHAMVLALATAHGEGKLEYCATDRFKDYWKKNWDPSAFIRMMTKESGIYASYNLGAVVKKIASEHRDQLMSHELDGLYREFAFEVIEKSWPNARGDFIRRRSKFYDIHGELKRTQHDLLKVTGKRSEETQVNSSGQQDTSTAVIPEPASQGMGNEPSDQNLGEMARDNGAKLG